MNLEQARFNMVEQQIRPWEVLDQNVLDLLFRIKREEFVPAHARAMAFMDMEIPLGHGEVMLSPKLEARIVQELNIQKTDKILEIGTGSGYMTALLATLGQYVYSVEINPEFTQTASIALEAHNVRNVHLDTGDAAYGWSANGPYDVIAITGSVPILIDNYQRDLKPGGRLFVVVGEPPIMEAKLITCLEEGVYNSTDLFETCIPPLRNAAQPARFIF